MPVTFYTPQFYVLNNFSPNVIESEGKLYPTAEHAYQAAKLTDGNAKEQIKESKESFACPA